MNAIRDGLAQLPDTELPSRGVRTALRTAVAVAAVAAAVVAVTPALGVRDTVLHLFGTSRGAPAVLAAEAQQVVALNLPSGDRATLWQAPTTTGGQCVFMHVAAAGSIAASQWADGSTLCSTDAGKTQPTPIQAIVDWLPSHGSFLVLVHGHLADASGITRINLSTAAASSSLPVKYGYFLGFLGSSSTAGALPSPATLNGYSNAGETVAQVDLSRLVGSSTP
jgi:hypothetical protein